MIDTDEAHGAPDVQMQRIGGGLSVLKQHQKPSLTETANAGCRHLIGIKPFVLLFLVLMVWLGLIPSSHAQSPGKTEYYFKAAFLANFARLVDWPVSAFKDEWQPLMLCVLDPEPFGDALEAINGKMIRGRKLVVVTCEEPLDVARCHILFANSADESKRKLHVLSAADHPILIIGETQGFAENEGMINFVSAKDKIFFEINQTRTAQAGLKISSRLLRLGRIVESDVKP